MLPLIVGTTGVLWGMALATVALEASADGKNDLSFGAAATATSARAIPVSNSDRVRGLPTMVAGASSVRFSTSLADRDPETVATLRLARAKSSDPPPVEVGGLTADFERERVLEPGHNWMDARAVGRNSRERPQVIELRDAGFTASEQLDYPDGTE